jgi:hypothetical protein
LEQEDVQKMHVACADGWKYYAEVQEKIKSFKKDQVRMTLIFW